MENRENSETQEESTDDKTEVKTVDPLRGLKKANKTLASERDKLAGELAKLKEDAEKAKLSDTERANAELKRLEKERDDAKAEALRAKAERETERKVSQLVAKHGLRDPEFGEIVLRQFNPDEHDDFDTFVTQVKKNKRYEPLFKELDDARVTDEDGEDIVPERPKAGKSVKTKATNTDHEDFARKQWPNDEARQKTYLANIASLSKGR